MNRTLSRGTLASTFARSFLIQGSWNYHTMLGSGFAFAMLPVLRRLYGKNGERMDAAVARHLEHFNAHPYMCGLALGATLRLEADGCEADTIRRFKLAVRGPLGSLGDSLVWATWLPGVAVAALVLFWLGSPGWTAAVFFLVVYNVGHIGLRVWGFRVGVADGRNISGRLASANLPGWVARLQPIIVALLGVLVGAIVGGRGGLVDSGGVWLLLAAAAFLLGLLGGHKAWRPAAIVTVTTIAAVAGFGVLK